MYPLECILNISYMLYNMQRCDGKVLNHQQMLFFSIMAKLYEKECVAVRENEGCFSYNLPILGI